MRIIGASTKHTGNWPCPPGFNGKLRNVYRWFSGRPMNGHRYTDATGFRHGTFAVDISGHAWSYHYWPGYQKFLVARLPAMAVGPLAILWLFRPLVVVWAVAIMATLAIPPIRTLAKDRGHRKNVVEPVAMAVAKVVNRRYVRGHGHEWVAIPRDFRDNPAAIVAIQLPPNWTADKGDMARVTETVAKRLAMPDIMATWNLAGMAPYVEYSQPVKPPKGVDVATGMAMAERVSDTELAMGAGPHGKPCTFSLALESPHLLIASASGGGKSVLLAYLVGQLMRRGYGLVILDAKYISHMWARRVPGVLYASEDEELHETLIWLNSEMLKRARFVANGGDPAKLQPFAVLLEEMTGATNRLRAYWQTIKGSGDPMMSPALTALANLSSMGRELRVHIFMAGQSMTSKATGGVENRENFGGRALARATVNQWKMLAPQIKPAPVKRNDPGRWHLVVGDTLRDFQAPFWDLKDDAVVAELIAWATGGEPFPDMVAMRAGLMTTQHTEVKNASSGPGSSPVGISLGDYVATRPGLTLTQVQNWRRRFADTFPEPVAEGDKGAKLYEESRLDRFVWQRTEVS
jgi:hypothetical protein